MDWCLDDREFHHERVSYINNNNNNNNNNNKNITK